MTLTEKWNLLEKFVSPEVRQIARAAYFAGYAEALAAAGDLEGAQRVLDELWEGKCG